MRKTYLALAAAGLILASCQKDNEPSPQLPPTAPQSAMTLRGTIDASTPESRTHLDEEAGGGGKNSSLVKWDLYDAVALYMTGAFDRRVQELADSVTQGLQPSVQFVTPEFYVVKSAESIDNTTATFTGTSAVTPLASDTYVAVYPYRSVSTDAWQIGRTHIRMTLPEQQSHPFQFKDLGMMIAKTPDSGSEQVRLSFKNIFPILKFSLTGSRTLAAIRFRGNDGEPVAGDFRLDISGDAYMEADFSESTVEEVSLTCGVRLSATPQTFYLVVPPRTYAKGYTIDFVADDGSVMTQVVSKDTPKTLLRSKIYEYPTLAFPPQSTAEAACDWLWQDETGVVSNVGFDELPGAVDLGAAANCFIVSVPGNYKFKAVKGDGSAVDGVDGYVYFAAGAAKGNAVIAALVNRQVAWSWHIWRTDAPAEKEAAAGCTILDRNLGATSVTPGDVSSYGLYYQWGRKDPFVGAKDTGKDAPIGGASETAAFGTQTAAYEKNTIDQTAYAFDVIGNDDNTIIDCVAYAVQHPTTFIKYVASVGNSGVSTWFNSDLSNFSDLWGAVSGRKSVYDPCPAGYKVPVDSAEAWGGFAKADVTSSAGSFGVTLNEAFYPCSGWRDVSGMLKQVGTYAKAASATASENRANILQMGYYKMMATAASYSISFTNPGKSFIAGGIPVRCVKE